MTDKYTYNGDLLEQGKWYIYVKNERTGSSTIRKLKKVGKCISIGNVTAKFECYVQERAKGYGTDTVHIDDVICRISEEQAETRFWWSETK